jgi:hypothetical protein
MMPCCDLCYKKYLEEDGSLDEKAYQDALGEFAVWLSEQRKTKKTVGFDTRLDEAKNRKCRCACHVKGRNILH